MRMHAVFTRIPRAIATAAATWSRRSGVRCLLLPESAFSGFENFQDDCDRVWTLNLKQDYRMSYYTNEKACSSK